MSACPRCKEEIAEGDNFCPHCGHNINKVPWYFRNQSLVVAFLVAGPLILPLVWFNPRFSKVKKTVLTLVIIGLTGGIMYGFTYLLGAEYQKVQDMLWSGTMKF